MAMPLDGTVVVGAPIALVDPGDEGLFFGHADEEVLVVVETLRIQIRSGEQIGRNKLC